MDTKLTLKLDKDIIERAKEYASAHKRSLSGIIESYLQSLTGLDESKDMDDIEITPFIKSISSGSKLPDGFDYKKEYRDHLEEKYR
ncbi:DUF6364 family protein [Dyadobacter diqingensis]|uniref:DUF6364 family protein n=1 Tax=Dyadobacter diqingensis TaxID=2938121 RepID=UPI0020C1A2CC|nr:DUF6364 family protein [Dyadobacter diqingensis]